MRSNAENNSRNTFDEEKYYAWISIWTYRVFTAATFVNILVGAIVGKAANKWLALMWFLMLGALWGINKYATKKAKQPGQSPEYIKKKIEAGKKETLLIGYLVTIMGQLVTRLQESMGDCDRIISVLMVIVLMGVYLLVFGFATRKKKVD